MQRNCKVAAALSTIGAFGAISACSTAKTPPPAVEIRTITKTVEVAKPCPVEKPERPAPLARPLPSDAVSLAALLGAKLLAYAGPGAWADRMEDALDTCMDGAD